MIKLLRQHLMKNNELVNMLSEKDSIFYIDRPSKRTDKTYLVVKDKLLSSNYIEDYQITFHIVTQAAQQSIEIEKELVNYLNDPRGEKIVKDEDTYIRNIQVINGGGTIRTPENDYLTIVYFIVKK